MMSLGPQIVYQYTPFPHSWEERKLLSQDIPRDPAHQGQGYEGTMMVVAPPLQRFYFLLEDSENFPKKVSQCYFMLDNVSVFDNVDPTWLLHVKRHRACGVLADLVGGEG